MSIDGSIFYSNTNSIPKPPFYPILLCAMRNFLLREFGYELDEIRPDRYKLLSALQNVRVNIELELSGIYEIEDEKKLLEKLVKNTQCSFEEKERNIALQEEKIKQLEGKRPISDKDNMRKLDKIKRFINALESLEGALVSSKDLQSLFSK